VEIWEGAPPQPALCFAARRFSCNGDDPNDLLVRGSAYGASRIILTICHDGDESERSSSSRFCTRNQVARSRRPAHSRRLSGLSPFATTATAVGSDRQLWHFVDGSTRPSTEKLRTQSRTTATQDYTDNLHGIFITVPSSGSVEQAAASTTGTLRTTSGPTSLRTL